MSIARILPALASVLLLAACAREPAADPAPAAPAPPPVAPAPPEVATAEAPAPRLADVPESKLAESADSRDPFRSFTSPVVPPKDTRPRKSRHYALGELKLVGLVTHTATPRAMLVDPAGKGWVVVQGELLGRPEVVREGDAVASASWRVDRIRESDVVLVREDAAHRDAPGETRVLALQQEPTIAAIDD